MSKILIVRMLELGDVATIGLSTLRHIQSKNPTAQMYFLTHGQGEEIIALAEPNVTVLTLPEHIWPDNLIAALEAFLGIAEKIIEIEFDQIFNFDTAFMPCFLARFLKDAGEPVHGNYINRSLNELIAQIQQQTLESSYVNEAQNYLQSTFFSMFKWHTQWWENDVLPEKGYPEFYVKQCCGFIEAQMDYVINPTQKNASASKQKVIYLGLDDQINPYQETNQLIKSLRNNGFKVVVNDQQGSMEAMINGLSNSDLVVCLPNAVYAIANCVGTRTLLLAGEMDPRILMPDYATDCSLLHPSASELTQSIESIFESDIDE